ncbi:hypothetical protein N7495_000969 [Penicillium taxi]|uniref:uncharacterized protein n=1 Tax=Penicillium taxi TaxID=168475 RepID=UPI0025456633|nr:uncharacterized protein N7495_000969 [Penicillium taxi]KAJ5908287.1 hypothetical protein N7495_000969 [Penicillium taxi]
MPSIKDIPQRPCRLSVWTKSRSESQLNSCNGDILSTGRGNQVKFLKLQSFLKVIMQARFKC